MPPKSLKAKWPFYTSMDHLYNTIDRFTEIQPTEVVLFAHASISWNKPFTCPFVPSIFQLGNAHAHKVKCCVKFCMHEFITSKTTPNCIDTYKYPSDGSSCWSCIYLYMFDQKMPWLYKCHFFHILVSCLRVLDRLQLAFSSHSWIGLVRHGNWQRCNRLGGTEAGGHENSKGNWALIAKHIMQGCPKKDSVHIQTI